MTTYYELLGVEPNADDDVIKAAFRKALKEHHPDLNSGDATAERESRKLIQAYNVLKVPAKRARYDRALQRRRPGSRRILTLIAAGNAAIVVFGGLMFILLFRGDTNGTPPAPAVVATPAAGEATASAEVWISKLTPPPATTAGLSPEAPPPAQSDGEAAQPDPTAPQPLPHLAAWQAIESTGTMAELWTYAKTYPNTLEATLAELRLWRLIDASRDRASLKALADQATGRVAERVRRRLEALMGERPVVLDWQPSPGETGPAPYEGAPVLPR